MSTIATQLLELSAETTSPTYISDAETFVEYASHDRRNLFVYYEHGAKGGVTQLTEAADLEREDWTVHGFALAGRYTQTEYTAQLHVPMERLLAETPLTEADFPLSVVKVLAVSPDQQARGIGTQLGAAAAAEMFRHPPVATMIWLRDNPANVKLAEHYSEFVLARFASYFPDDWACPDCGTGNDCTCDVALYGWFADERAMAVKASVSGKTRIEEHAD